MVALLEQAMLQETPTTTWVSETRVSPRMVKWALGAVALAACLMATMVCPS